MTYTSTYSPEDNKLRLYASARLDSETCARVKSAGFIWAPKQQLFVAPMWTPSREDLLIELAGEIDDEDRSLVDRAEERADRFSDYKESRIEDAERAQAAVSSIADNIPFGQPILVGHHSERRARKDAERIQNGMRKTVQMWETAKYWEARAAGAIRHAKYKELPGVRHRRIKKLEADKRQHERSLAHSEAGLKLWTACQNEQDNDLQKSVALKLSQVYRMTLNRKDGDRDGFNADAYTALTGEYPNLYAPRTIEEVFETAQRVYPKSIAYQQRWIDHYTNRIAYEKAMLGETGGLIAHRFTFEVGGKVLIGDEWLVILKINRTRDVLSSLTTTPRRHFYGSKYKADIESVKDYQAPKPEETAAVKAATKLPPMCNYPGDGFKHMTTAEWKRKKMSDVPQSATHAATDTHGAHRTWSTWGGNFTTVSVYLTDAKRIEPPTKEVPPNPTEPTTSETLETMAQELKAQNPLPTPYTPRQRDERIPSDKELHSLKTSAAAGVLEPSAGTGKILRAIGDGPDKVAVELNLACVQRLATCGVSGLKIHEGDFLDCNGELGKFDRVLMNPPFENASDIKHIEHALHMLKPGGRLVAICANGPRQNAILRPLVDAKGGLWEELPPDTFHSAGTSVRTVLLTIRA